MNKSKITKKYLLTNQINALNNQFDLDIEKIMENLFPLKNEILEDEIEKINIKDISHFTNIFLSVDVYTKKYVTSYDLIIDPFEKTLEVDGPDSLYYDKYTIENNIPLLKRTIYINDKNNIKIIKKYTNKENNFLKRNIGEMSYQTYEYLFIQNDFKVMIKFNLETDKEFDEEKFINSLLNIEVVVTNINELKNIIMVLSCYNIIPDNEGFYEIIPIKSKKLTKVK